MWRRRPGHRRRTSERCWFAELEQPEAHRPYPATEIFSPEVEMVDEPVPVEHVAEALWQSIERPNVSGPAVRRAWMALPIIEKEAWRRRAEDVIADWKRTKDQR
jgi:hypothetical protein